MIVASDASLSPEPGMKKQRALPKGALWPEACRACAVLPVVVGYDNGQPIVTCDTLGCINRGLSLGLVSEWNERQRAPLGDILSDPPPMASPKGEQ